jgi:hypothetical protein
MIRITDVKQQNKKALYMILHKQDLCEQYATELNNISFLGAQNLDGMPHGSNVGNPTQQKALKLTDIESKKNWIITIEAMENTLPENQVEFLRLRRMAEDTSFKAPVRGRPSWVAFVQTRYNDWYNKRYGKETCISEDTLKSWQARIVDKTVRIAIYNGCFSF